MKSRAPLYAGLAIVAVIVGALAAQLFGSGSRLIPDIALTNGTALPEPRALPDFSLLDHHQQPFTRTQLQGHWSVVFFGYTNCPDVCPTTLALLKQVDLALSDLPAAQRPQVVFVSVDPRRDKPEQMANYVGFFNPAFIGLSGEQNQLDVLTHAMGVPVLIHDTGNGTYTVDHAATLFLIDPQGRTSALFSPPHQVTTLTADIRHVIVARS
jgi:protein SCO1